MNLYEIKTGDNKIWIYATDPITAVHAANVDDLIDLGAAGEGDDISIVPEEKWGEYFVSDEYGNQVESFRDHLSREIVGKRTLIVAITTH